MHLIFLVLVLTLPTDPRALALQVPRQISDQDRIPIDPLRRASPRRAHAPWVWLCAAQVRAINRDGEPRRTRETGSTARRGRADGCRRGGVYAALRGLDGLPCPRFCIWLRLAPC
ncbi:hypothetical protein B0H19DRAFT_1184698 [Mycena capillaripes]|nr:hypothetical protein B0H19DRAFT_1184698 [Mycena capillaripes]